MNWRVNDLGGVLRLVMHYAMPLGGLFLIALGQHVAGVFGMLVAAGMIGLAIYVIYKQAQRRAVEHLAGVRTQVVEVVPNAGGLVVKAADRELARLGTSEGELDGERVTIHSEGPGLKIEDEDGRVLARLKEHSRAPGNRKWMVSSPKRRIELKPAGWYFDRTWLGVSGGRSVAVCEPGKVRDSMQDRSFSDVAEELHPAEKVAIGMVASRVHGDPTAGGMTG